MWWAPRTRLRLTVRNRQACATAQTGWRWGFIQVGRLIIAQTRGGAARTGPSRNFAAAFAFRFADQFVTARSWGDLRAGPRPGGGALETPLYSTECYRRSAVVTVEIRH